MKKTTLLLALFLCAVMVTGCGKTAEKPSQPPAVTDTVANAKAALQSGEIRKAYDLLKTDDSDEAKAMLEKFAFTPQTVSGGDSVYTYDENGNLLSSDSSYDDLTYTYDEQGRVASIKWIYPPDWGFGWEYRSYIYNAKGEPQLLEWSDNLGIREKNTYDENGKLLTKETVGSDGNRTTTTYDAGGNPLTVELTKSDGSWQKTVCTYDQGGNLLSENDTFSDGDWSKCG